MVDASSSRWSRDLDLLIVGFANQFNFGSVIHRQAFVSFFLNRETAAKFSLRDDTTLPSQIAQNRVSCGEICFPSCSFCGLCGCFGVGCGFAPVASLAVKILKKPPFAGIPPLFTEKLRQRLKVLARLSIEAQRRRAKWRVGITKSKNKPHLQRAWE